MLEIDKKKLSKDFSKNTKSYSSVCNSCACGGGLGTCNSTCKGCKDKGENVKTVKDVYSK